QYSDDLTAFAIDVSIVGGFSSSFTRVPGTHARVNSPLLMRGTGGPLLVQALDVHADPSVTTGVAGGLSAVAIKDCDVDSFVAVTPVFVDGVVGHTQSSLAAQSSGSLIARTTFTCELIVDAAGVRLDR